MNVPNPCVRSLPFSDVESVPRGICLYVKMENTQKTGSFKLRGIINQFHRQIAAHGKETKFVTMSAGIEEN